MIACINISCNPIIEFMFPGFSRWHGAAILATGAAAYMFDTMITARHELTTAEMTRLGVSDIALSHAKQQAEQIKVTLEGLKGKTTAEKITAAYDASVQTHHIGFPKTQLEMLRKDKEREQEIEDNKNRDTKWGD